MRKALFVIALLVGFCSQAFHIVGGEIEFITLRAGLYKINVIQYFDEVQVENPGPEGAAEVYIFSNFDNSLISKHILRLEEQIPVSYTFPECARGELATSRVVWSIDSLELEPLEYADPEGYYIVWERCCRNETVVNINNPRSTGMKYTLEIPPLWKDGKPFINTSPVLFKPLSDYACINQLYYTEFTGIDPDGDSLAYSLVRPLNTVTQDALPIPQPKPHIIKNYRAGYEDIIPGNPALNISTDGLLTVKPSTLGLHVFSVLVEEYRNGVKIGEVRRDFQMLVLDGCDPPDPPELGIQIPGNPNFVPEINVLRYTLEEDKCVQFKITNFSENVEQIWLRTEGVNFEGNIEDFFLLSDTVLIGDQDTITFDACFPGCPPLLNEPFVVDIIAGDNACPLPQLDTLRLTVEIEPPPNFFPELTAEFSAVTVEEDSEFTNRIIATDADNDSMTYQIVVKQVDDPAAIGLSVTEIENRPGRLELDLNWDTDCLIYDFSEFDQFTVAVVANDIDQCDFPIPDTLWMDYRVILPPNSRPVLKINGFEGNFLEVDVFEEVRFEIEIEDADQDEVSLDLIGRSVISANVGLEFESVTGIGNAISEFVWTPDCSKLREGSNLFPFTFIGDDFDKCKVQNFDSLDFVVRVSVPVNTPPIIEIEDSTHRLRVNESFVLPIKAIDIDGDPLSLGFSRQFLPPESESLSFEDVEGVGEVNQVLTWVPECDLLQGNKSAVYQLIFKSEDVKCPVSKEDQIIGTFTIFEDQVRFEEFKPPNAFSPNGDGVNEVFRLSGSDIISENLPIDICDDEFQYFSIHDRTGNRIFYSEARDFVWDGANFPSGTYYYVVKYSKSEYRNYIQLLR
jgi:gliding motility-associated-like protein